MLMLKMLRQNPDKIPAPDKQTIIDLAMKCIRKLNNDETFDPSEAFKSVFVTNAFDGSEDMLISDRLKGLVYEDMVEFRKKLMESTPPKDILELFKSMTPPKGIKRKTSIEGGELFDHDDDGPEPDISELIKELEKVEAEDRKLAALVQPKPKPSDSFQDLEIDEADQDKVAKVHHPSSMFWPLAGELKN